MLEAILLGFFFVMLVVSIRRSISRVAKLQADRQPLRVDDLLRRPFDDYHDQTWLPLCEATAVLAVSRLNRPLAVRERRSIWRARSELALEVLQKEIQAAANLEDIVILILQLPTGIDRPDPTGWCNGTNPV
jgi:hypothetical protein